MRTKYSFNATHADSSLRASPALNTCAPSEKSVHSEPLWSRLPYELKERVLDELPLHALTSLQLVDKETCDLIRYGRPSHASSWVSYQRQTAQRWRHYAEKVVHPSFLAGESHGASAEAIGLASRTLLSQYRVGGPRQARQVFSPLDRSKLPGVSVLSSFRHALYDAFDGIATSLQTPICVPVEHKFLTVYAIWWQALLFDVRFAAPLGNTVAPGQSSTSSAATAMPFRGRVYRAELVVGQNTTGEDKLAWNALFRQQVVGPSLQELTIDAPLDFFAFEGLAPSNLSRFALGHDASASPSASPLPFASVSGLLGSPYLVGLEELTLSGYTLSLSHAVAWPPNLHQLTFKLCHLVKDSGATPISLPMTLRKLSFADVAIAFDGKFFAQPRNLPACITEVCVMRSSCQGKAFESVFAPTVWREDRRKEATEGLRFVKCPPASGANGTPEATVAAS